MEHAGQRPDQSVEAAVDGKSRRRALMAGDRSDLPAVAPVPGQQVRGRGYGVADDVRGGGLSSRVGAAVLASEAAARHVGQ